MPLSNKLLKEIHLSSDYIINKPILKPFNANIYYAFTVYIIIGEVNTSDLVIGKGRVIIYGLLK
jgi:hypothetical protein